MARRQQEKTQETYNELRESAIRLFGEKGFAATTIADITNSAGYAKGNFYRYWKTKDDLFLSVMEEKFSSYRETRALSLEKATDLESVMGVLMDFLEGIIDDGKWGKIFLEFTISASGNEDLRNELTKGIYRLSSGMFADIVAPYIRSDYSAQKLGAIVTALFEGYIIQSLLGVRVISKEDLRQSIMTLVKHMK